MRTLSLLLLSLFAVAHTLHAQTPPPQAAFYCNGAAGADLPAAGIPAGGPLGWLPGTAAAPQGWKTLQYAVNQASAWLAANPSVQVRTAVVYVQGNQDYSATANGEAYPVTLPPGVAVHGVAASSSGYPRLQPPAGTAALALSPGVNYFDRFLVSVGATEFRYSSTGLRYLRIEGGSVGLSMGAVSPVGATIRHNPRVEDCELVDQTQAAISVSTTSGQNDPKIYRNRIARVLSVAASRGVDMVAAGTDPILAADIEGCTFVGLLGAAVSVLDTATHNNAVGVGGIFRSNNYENCAAGVRIEAASGSGLRTPRVLKSRFDSILGAAVEVVLNNCQGQDLLVEECTMENCATGILVQGTPSGGQYGIQLDNNTMLDCDHGLRLSVQGRGAMAIHSQETWVRLSNQYGLRIEADSAGGVLSLDFQAERSRIFDCWRGAFFGGNAQGSARLRSSMLCRNTFFYGLQVNAPNLDMDLRGLTLADNLRGLWVAADGPGSHYSHLICAGNSTEIVAPGPANGVTYSCFQNAGVPGVGNLSFTNPQLERPYYKLRWTSPCIDVGSAAAFGPQETDYEGDARAQGANPCQTSNVPDLGADEVRILGSTSRFGNVGFGEFNTFPELSSPNTSIQFGTPSTLTFDLTNARQSFFGTPGVFAVLAVGLFDDAPFSLAPLGWPESFAWVGNVFDTSGPIFIQPDGTAQLVYDVSGFPTTLSGLTLCTQWVVFMPGPFRPVTSNGLRFTIGQTTPPVGGPLPNLNMAQVPAGTYTQGRAGLPIATPRQVTISQPFWVGRYEVTQAEYQALMGANPSTNVGPNLPVDGVSFADAQAYCAALDAQQRQLSCVPAGYEFRLPTEAEWEYACRAGTTTNFHFGNAITCADANHSPGLLVYCTGSSPTMLPVGSHPANAWGLYDMHGNAREWVLDRLDAGALDYPPGPVTDPVHLTGTLGILRGGDFRSPPDQCRSADRMPSLPPPFGSSTAGFRVVLAPVVGP